MLTRLEHRVLSGACNGKEPLHILFSEAKRDLGDVSPADFIGVIAKLVGLGYLSAYFFSYATTQYQRLPFVAEGVLMAHCAGRTYAELLDYPPESKDGEYFFEVTDLGRAEEAKDVYSVYYPPT